MTSYVDGTTFLAMTFRIPAVTASQYVRLRGTNLPAAVPFETDASGNPLADVYTNASNTDAAAHPVHHALTAPAASSTAARTTWRRRPAPTARSSGQKAVSFDVAAWADLWFYSNPIYIEVTGSTPVAGVQ